MNAAPRLRRVREHPLECLRGYAMGHPELSVVLRGDEVRSASTEDQPVDEARVRVALQHDAPPWRGEREAQRVVALTRAVGEKPCPRGPIGVGRKVLGPLVRGRRGTDIDPLDVLRHIEGERAVAERAAQTGIGSGATLVAGNVEPRRAAEAVGGDGVKVGRGRLCRRGPGAHRAAFNRYARMKPSRSPSRTRLVSPTSKSVRWSLTIE